MPDLNVQQQLQLNNYLKSNPKVTKDQAMKLLFGGGKITSNSGKGVSVESPSNGQKQLTLPSGRKIVVKDGKTAYYSSDGTALNQKFFESKEGSFNVCKSGRYSVTKNGVNKYYAADGTEIKASYFKAKEGIKENIIVKTSDGKSFDLNKTMQNRLNNVSKNLEKAEDKNGLIGKTWSGVKNLTGMGDSSDKVRELQQTEQNLLSTFTPNSKNKEKTFELLTGQKFTPENLEKFIKGEIRLKSELALNGYNEGQEMVVDVSGDVISGIAAVGIYTLAVAAAPVTGGASIALGVAAAAATGSAVKAGIKYVDAKTGGREYNSLGKDLATGAFSGVLAPVTGGLGGAVGKTVATKLGVQAVKQVGKEVGKEVAEEVVETGVKQAIKTALTNPTGYEYVGGNLLKKGLAYGAEMAVDGSVGGAVDNAFRKAVDGGSAGEVLEATKDGFVGGLILSPVIGGGFKTAGKIGMLPFNQIPNDVPQVVIPQKTLTDLYPASDASEIAAMKQSLSQKARGTEKIELRDLTSPYMYKKENISEVNGIKKTYLSTYVDGDYQIYKSTQSGSNPGFWVEHAASGDLYYFKTGNGLQNITENVSSQLYKAAGIETPDMNLVGGPGFSAITSADNCWIKSKAIAGLKPISENPKAAYEGFAVDAWLANWDAVISENTLIKDGKAVRLDFGGTLDFRAQGARKKFGNEVPELSTLLDPKINPGSAEVFADMTRDDLISSLKRVQSVKNEEINKIYDSVRIYINPETFTTINNRKTYMGYILEEAEQSPMNLGQNIQDYVKNLEEIVAKKYKNQITEMNNNSSKRLRIMNEMKAQRNAVSSKEDIKSILDYKCNSFTANTCIQQGRMDDPLVTSLDKALSKTKLTEPITLYRGDHFKIDTHINTRYLDDFPEYKDAYFHETPSSKVVNSDPYAALSLKMQTTSFVDGKSITNDLEPMSEIIKRIYKKGKIVKEQQFVSTTVDSTVAKQFGKDETDIIYKFNAPKGISAVNTENLPLDDIKTIAGANLTGAGGVEGSEAEILLARGFKYQMKNLTFEDEHYVIECDILPN